MKLYLTDELPLDSLAFMLSPLIFMASVRLHESSVPGSGAMPVPVPGQASPCLKYPLNCQRTNGVETPVGQAPNILKRRFSELVERNE